MHIPGILLGAFLHLLPPAPAVIATTARDTTAPRPDASSNRAEVVHPSVTFDFGAGPGLPIEARTIEFTASRPVSRDGNERAPTLARVRVVRTPDTLSALLARRVATGEPLPALDARLPGSSSSPGLVVHLHEVRVSSTRLVMSDDTLALAQQRLALEESITQLTVDLAEARRQFGVAEQLERQRLSPSLELARVRGTVEALTKRLATQQERRAMVALQLARWTPVQEEVVLEAGRAEVEAVTP